MKWFRKRIISPILQRFVRFYFKKERKFHYGSIKAVVLPGVFFPHFTLSTRFLMSFLEHQDLNGMSFLELGCGTGMISALAAKKGAKVLATDINPKALENAKRNADLNQVKLETLHSDLFKQIPSQQFDFIVINPPYYPKQPNNDAEKAWFCGENFEYFEKLFSTLKPYVQVDSKVLMVLSEDCELAKIQSIAQRNGFKFLKKVEKKIRGERNYIFQIV
ncbi:MAG: methyltransferase [Flavobacteriales bacterium]|nr:methyltransferase [Flavobacteriales bacterium]